ncbi:hypothetical protein [Encephalitozoon cuniculi GB-M1]|uniref:Uncharacterized protein n=1 Tax=Encephalitozoon cuniculi (strain GB-M1) TaxID=284813 RepID=Q8SU67_ENCCU|nr:uncharacterized protein ECU11_0490 [Encephalitozoon cuniculi GB-M1]CAD25959.1 hypothetical protein [Encephalitozoon cuniculi GB-M1]
MERIDKVFNEIRDVRECYARYLSLKNRRAEIEKDMAWIEEEIRRAEATDLEREIEEINSEYQGILESIEKLSLSSRECRSIEDLEAVFSKITDIDVLMKKSLEFLRCSVVLIGIDQAGIEAIHNLPGDGELLAFRVDKDVERLFQVSAEYPEMQKKCYLLFKSTVHGGIQGVVPADMKVFQDERALFFVFRGDSAESSEHPFAGRIVEIGPEEISKYKMTSHAIFGALRDNLREMVVERSLSDESVERSNAFFRETEFYIHNIPEWRLDVVMKEIIEMTKGPRSMDAVETLESSDRMPKFVSTSYKRFLACFELFRTLKSKRHEKGARIVDRAIMKLFDPKRYEPSVYSHFIEFADITHFLRTYPGYSLADELSKRKEMLFFDVVRESSRVNVSLSESLVTLKLYFKEKHVEFAENLESFVPMINRNLFEIQFFEMLDEGLMEKILGLGMAKSSTIRNLVLLIDYVLDLSFHLPTGAIRNQDKLRSYKQVLSLDREALIKSYRNGELCVSHEEFGSLCSLAFRESEDRRFLLSKMEE